MVSLAVALHLPIRPHYFERTESESPRYRGRKRFDECERLPKRDIEILGGGQQESQLLRVVVMVPPTWSRAQ